VALMATHAASAFTYVDAEGVTLECFPVSTEEGALADLLTDLYRHHWNGIQFGTLIQGAVWEIAVDKPPESIGVLDGYLTVNFGLWHFHVCIGEHRGTKGRPVAPELARIRRTSRAEFFRRLNDDGTPNSWGFQMFNGISEVQMTVFFPNPYLDRDGKVQRRADWARLNTWDVLRQRHAGLGQDDRDRCSSGFVHG
jgi:hypothetical protein